MNTQTSHPQAKANRLNALKSTGPRSESGKQRSAQNSLRHGLSSSVHALNLDPRLQVLTGIIEQEGLGCQEARLLATRILDYERNEAYQREIYALDSGADQSQQTLPDGLENEVSLFVGHNADELKLIDHALGKRASYKRRQMRGELMHLRHHLLRQWAKTYQGEEHQDARRIQASIRYLKRSSNQLIKAFKALGTEP